MTTASTTSSPRFSFGDAVVHPGKPEWGSGVVTGVQAATHNGQSCQRVSIRFDRAGLKKVLTAVAPIEHASEANAAAPAGEGANLNPNLKPNLKQEPATWLEELEQKSPEEVFAKIPDAARDPFASPADRAQSCAKLYRFNTSGSSLLDWAAAQSGLVDPLSKFTRQQLEGFFERFVTARDRQMADCLWELKKANPDAAAALTKQLPGEAQHAVRAINTRR